LMCCMHGGGFRSDERQGGAGAMPVRMADVMDALVSAATRVLEVHGSDVCRRPECVALGLAGRCLAYRIADEAIGTWANRVHLAGHARPGSTGGVPLVGHPAWCIGESCREVDGERTHVSAPDRVANVLVTLMHGEGEPPVLTICDLVDPSVATTVVVPAAFASSLARSVRLLGQRGLSADSGA
jgi:hypothetical protein